MGGSDAVVFLLEKNKITEKQMKICYILKYRGGS